MYRFTFSFLSLLLPFQLLAGQFDSVKELLIRRVPWLEQHVVFKPLKNTGQDIFELSSLNGKILISASGPNAAAVGLNWYLKEYCHRSMSHMGDNLSPVSPLPAVKGKVRITSTAKYRYALNYCTYNYTMSFYNWEDWERELDWMALNGVNMMLSVAGMEAVWQNTLRKIGYRENEIQDFITGPAYTAWWLMGNIEGWGGPMPQSQINNRVIIQQKMLKRMKALGIEPVMQGFYGMVPSTLKDKTKAHIIDQKTWGAFKRPDILSPNDPEFARIAGIYYSEMRKLYGKDIRFFAGDPFHEGGETAGIDLKQAGTAIQAAMQKFYPLSTWVLQGWQDNPKEQMLEGLDKSKVIVQELFGEFTNNWESRKAFSSSPFIWCVVNNFGERPGMYGKLQRFSDEVTRIKSSNFSRYWQGVGIMPEGINNNPPVYDLMLELGWRQEHVKTADWITRYASYRYGVHDENINTAWQGFLETIYQSLPGYQEGAPESIFCARPALKIKSVSSWGTMLRSYDVKKFEQAAATFAKPAPEFMQIPTYRIDLINVSRQILANRGDSVFKQVIAAYDRKDLDAFDKYSKQFVRMIDLTDELLNADTLFQLNTYLKQALRLGDSPQEKANNLNNALMLITYWGKNIRAEDNLHEYAYKEWSGLMNAFYLQRWQMYFNFLREELESKPTQAPDFFAWERQWVANNQQLQPERTSRPLNEIVNEIFGF